MIKTVFRRLSGNRWKALSLLVGLILAIAILYIQTPFCSGS